MDHQRNSRVIRETSRWKWESFFYSPFSAKSFSKGKLEVTREDEFELVKVSTTSKGWRKYESRDPEETMIPRNRRRRLKKEKNVFWIWCFAKIPTHLINRRLVSLLDVCLQLLWSLSLAQINLRKLMLKCNQNFKRFFRVSSYRARPVRSGGSRDRCWGLWRKKILLFLGKVWKRDEIFHTFLILSESKKYIFCEFTWAWNADKGLVTRL